MTDERTTFELEYWRLILADVEKLSEQLSRAATENMEISTWLVQAIVAEPAEFGGMLVQASRASRETMNALYEMSAPIERLAQLIDGRLTALAEAAA